VPYKVKQTSYSIREGRSVERLVNTADVIYDALTEKSSDYGSLDDRLSIEEKIRATGLVVSKLVARLLDAKVISPDDVGAIVGYDLDFKGTIVWVDNSDE